MTVLVIGDANADLCATTERFPLEGDDSRLRDLEWSSGGTAINVATALAHLGARARPFVRVGQDPAADMALRAAKNAGADLGAIQRDPSMPTGLCFAAVSPGGERTFFSYRGANMALAMPAGGEDPLRDVSWVQVGGHALLEGRQRETTLALIDEAWRRRVPISLDLCLPLLRAEPSLPLALAPKLRILFANEPELEALAPALDPDKERSTNSPVERAVEAFARRGATLVVAKLGRRGSVLRGDARQSLAPFVVEARDTTGCGDAYVAGFLFAHMRGAAPEVCGRLANALGALTATRPGAADALPTRDEIVEFLEEHAAEAELALLSAAAKTT